MSGGYKVNKIFDNLYTLLEEDLSSLIEISGDFYDQLSQELPTIISLIQLGNYTSAKKLAHKLKGSSMNFYLPVMTEAFITLENTLSAQEYDNAIACCTIIENEISVFHDHLERLK